MQTAIKIIFISSLLLSIDVYGQEKTPGLREDKTKLQTEELKSSTSELKASEETSPLIRDSSKADNKEGRKQRMRKRLMDSFLDKDGDGINDCRENGMRWNRKSEGKGKQKGFGRHGK